MFFRMYMALLVCMVLCTNAGAQGKIKESKAKKLYKKAYLEYGRGDYEKCLEIANEALEKDSQHMNTLILLTNVYNIQRDYPQELKVYHRILRIDSNDIRSHINMADIFMKTGAFEKAYHQYAYLNSAGWLPERYNSFVSGKLQKSEKALEIIEHPKEFNRERLSGEVNSELDEYWPYITPDGKRLYFTQTNFTHMADMTELRREENIYCVKLKDSLWVKKIKLPEIINTFENEGAQCITQDGKTMFFTVCKTTIGNQGDCNIYYAKLKNGKWSKPIKLPSPLNTPFKETQPSISYDGKTLFFSSDRPGGKGGMDIWASRMNEDSLWSNPLNLGSYVNTDQNEESPFIHADNTTLYFSSTGHDGLGNGDFFMVKLHNNSDAINLGYPLNNHEMQLGIFVDLEGKYGYYASVDPAYDTGLDIYRFSLPDDVKPEPLKIINGRLVDAIEKTPIAGGSIVVYNLANNQHVVSYTTLKSGGFKFGLPANTRFAILAENEGYLPYSIHSDVDELATDSVLEIALMPILPDGVFALKNIFFDFDSANLKNNSMPEIAYLAEFLRKYPKISIEIGGHTDNVGSEEYNQKLSQNRALAVFAALEEIMGSSISSRVQVKGYGAQVPVADNTTEEGRQQNRRTEIKILSVN
ncbi:OmpA family protein [bacterium]|nr:OmpA family protein [bacterium]